MKGDNDTSQQIHSWYQSFQLRFIQIGLNFGYKREDIQDFINQFFLDLLEKKIDPASISNPEAYLSSAFKRKLIDHYRQSKKRVLVDAGTINESCFEPPVQERLEQIQANADLINQIQKAYQNLPDRCKKVIYLKFYKGLTTEEIALHTGLTKRTVYNNLFEGVKLLRAGLNQMSPGIHVASLLSIFPLIMMEVIK